MPETDDRTRRHWRLSAERRLQHLPRQQVRPCQGAGQHSESAAAGHRSGVRTERPAARAVARMISAWLAFWDTSHPIYVNARHKDVHYRMIAQALARLVPGPTARVLDYGSGEALHADLVAAAAGEVLLCDGAPQLRSRVAA